MLGAIPQILQLGKEDEGEPDVEDVVAAVSALENILEESRFAPDLRCRENGPSDDGTIEEEDDVGDVATLALLLPLLVVPDDANGLEFKSDVANCNLGCRRILLLKIDVADARLDDVVLGKRLDVLVDERTDGFTSFWLLPLVVKPASAFAKGLLILLDGRMGSSV